MGLCIDSHPLEITLRTGDRMTHTGTMRRGLVLGAWGLESRLGTSYFSTRYEHTENKNHRLRGLPVLYCCTVVKHS